MQTYTETADRQHTSTHGIQHRERMVAVGKNLAFPHWQKEQEWRAGSDECSFWPWWKFANSATWRWPISLSAPTSSARPLANPLLSVQRLHQVRYRKAQARTVRFMCNVYRCRKKERKKKNRLLTFWGVYSVCKIFMLITRKQLKVFIFSTGWQSK